MDHACRSALILTLLVVACGGPSTGVQPLDATPADGGPIGFNLHEISAESRNCGEPGGKCARIKVTVPAAELAVLFDRSYWQVFEPVPVRITPRTQGVRWCSPRKDRSRNDGPPGGPG